MKYAIIENEEFARINLREVIGMVRPGYECAFTAETVEECVRFFSAPNDIRLINLDVHYCYNLSSLDISGLDKLESVDISLTNLKKYPLSNFPNTIKTLDLSFLGYESFDASSFPSLEKITINDNRLTFLDLSQCALIQEVSATSNILTSANFDNCEYLSYLALSYNSDLTQLSLNGCTALQYLFIHRSGLNGYNLAPFANTLKELNISYLAGYTVEDLAGFPYLTYLECQGCLLTGTLNLNSSPLLQTLRCEENSELKSVDLTDCSHLKELHCYFNQNLENIKLPLDQKNLQLVNLFQIPKVKEIDIRNMIRAENVSINSSGVKKLDISECNPDASSYYLDYNENLKEVKVWPTFDIANPPTNVTIPATAKFVYEFSE